MSAYLLTRCCALNFGRAPAPPASARALFQKRNGEPGKGIGHPPTDNICILSCILVDRPHNLKNWLKSPTLSKQAAVGCPVYHGAVAVGLVGDVSTSEQLFRRLLAEPAGYEWHKRLQADSANLAQILPDQSFASLFNVAGCSAVIGPLSGIIMVILSQRTCPVASFTMKHALLCSSTIQGGGKRRGDGMGRFLKARDGASPGRFRV